MATNGSKTQKKSIFLDFVHFLLRYLEPDLACLGVKKVPLWSKSAKIKITLHFQLFVPHNILGGQKLNSKSEKKKKMDFFFNLVFFSSLDPLPWVRVYICLSATSTRYISVNFDLEHKSPCERGNSPELVS